MAKPTSRTNDRQPWYRQPLYSGGDFSPRLLLAWQTFYFMLWLIQHWIYNEPKVSNGILVQPAGIEGIVGILAGIVVTALGLGTYQKIQLNRPAPETEAGEVAAPPPAPAGAGE